MYVLALFNIDLDSKLWAVIWLDSKYKMFHMAVLF